MFLAESLQINFDGSLGYKWQKFVSGGISGPVIMARVTKICLAVRLGFILKQ